MQLNYLSEFPYLKTTTTTRKFPTLKCEECSSTSLANTNGKIPHELSESHQVTDQSASCKPHCLALIIQYIFNVQLSGLQDTLAL